MAMPLDNIPEFSKDSQGHLSAVKLVPEQYISLLIQANVTDATLWPPGMENDAKMLARVRQIEEECIVKHGEFDWEKLPPDIQDEYDILCVQLDELCDTGEQISWEEYKLQRESRR